MSSQRKVLVVLGYPMTHSFCGGLAESYAEGAKEAGHEVQQLNL